MQRGSCHLWGEDLEDFQGEVRLAGELGFSTIAIGDSPAAWHELYLSMHVAAVQAPDARVAAFVTSPFLRHPIVAANAMSTLHDLTGGRVVMGVAVGGSNVMSVGRRPATQVEIREYFGALRDLFAGRPTTYEGRPVAPLAVARPVPIYYSAFGPKALALAGELADGVIMFNGEDMDALDGKLAIVREAAERAGRDPAAIDVWVTAYTSVRPTREEAIHDLKAFIAVNGIAIRTPEGLAAVPADLQAPLAELHRRYDPAAHVVAGGSNTVLIDELGLTDWLSTIDTVAGPPEHVREVLDRFEQRGVSTFIATLPGHLDKRGTLRRLSALHQPVS